MAETIAQTQQPQIDATIWGESKGYWAQTGVVFLAVVVAVIALIMAKLTERRKAAAAVIFACRQDSTLIEAIRRITTLHETEQNIAALARKDKNDTDEAKSIRYALNHYEYVSVGIRQGIYDEKIFKSSSYTTLVKLYERTKPFIEEVRKAQPTAFQEFECLACRWKNKPLKHKPVKLVPG